MTATANQFGHWRTGAVATDFIAAAANANNRTQRSGDARFPRFERIFGAAYTQTRGWAAFAGFISDWLTPPAAFVERAHLLDAALAHQLALQAALGAAVEAAALRSTTLAASVASARASGADLAAVLFAVRIIAAGMDAARSVAVGSVAGLDAARLASLALAAGLNAAAQQQRTATGALAAVVGAQRERPIDFSAALGQASAGQATLGGVLRAAPFVGASLDAALAGEFAASSSARTVSAGARDQVARPSQARAIAPGVRSSAMTLADGRTLVVPPGTRRH